MMIMVHAAAADDDDPFVQWRQWNRSTEIQQIAAKLPRFNPALRKPFKLAVYIINSSDFVHSNWESDGAHRAFDWGTDGGSDGSKTKTAERTH
jgi:hypothetical protein